jgi:hypothetical protein
MNLDNDTYAIIKYRGKPKLALVLNGKSRQAVLDESLSVDTPVNFTYEEHNVLCALGATPQPGTLYGVKVEPFHKTIETKRYGPIHLFRDMKKEELDTFKSSLTDVYNTFKREISIDFLPLFAIHVRNKKGKYAGSYKAQTQRGEHKDVVSLHPHDFNDEAFNRYLIAHEFAHGVWYRCVSHKLRASWIKLYEKRMKLNSVAKDKLEDLFDSVITYEGGLTGFIKEVADDEDRLVLREVLAYLKKHHLLNKNNVELLVEFDSEALGLLWPTFAFLTDKRADLGQYALSKVEEFFAEAVAYHISGKQLPDDVTRAILSTVKRI